MKSRKAVSWDKGKGFKKEKKVKKTVSFMLVFLVSVSLVSTFFVRSVSGAEKITLRFWATASSARDRGRRIIWRNFEKENPGVKVEFEGVPWDQFTEKILTSSIAGTLPDAVRYGFVARFASRGLLMPLEEFIKGPNGIDANEYLEGVFPNPSLTWDGKVYALPTAVMGYRFYYNRDILREEGVAPPKTWKELKTVAEKLTKKAPDGEVIRYGLQINENITLIDGFVVTNGKNLTDVYGHEATKATYSAPENMEGFQFLANLAKNKYLLPIRGEMAAKYFLEGKSAMYYGMDAHAFRPEIYPEFNWWIGPFPIPEGKPEVQPGNTADCSYIFKSTKYPQLAWKLVKAYSWKQGSPLVWIHKFGVVPPFKDVLDENTLNAYYYPFQFEAHLRKSFELVSKGILMSGPDRWHVKGEEIYRLEMSQYGLMLRGKKSVEEVVEYLDTKVGAMLPEKK